MRAELPLFPLRVVLYPDGILPLRLFEPRYLSMVGRCMREGGGFGVVLTRSGETSAERRGFHEQGTEAEITDWDRGEDGMLHIVARGRRRFVVRGVTHQPDGLIVGDVEYLDSQREVPLGPDDSWAVELFEHLAEGAPAELIPEPHRTDDAAWLSYRLCELLPLVPAQRQALLHLEAADARLDLLKQAVELMVAEETVPGAGQGS